MKKKNCTGFKSASPNGNKCIIKAVTRIRATYKERKRNVLMLFESIFKIKKTYETGEQDQIFYENVSELVIVV